jgi:hypothetical protein
MKHNPHDDSEIVQLILALTDRVELIEKALNVEGPRHKRQHRHHRRRMKKQQRAAKA